MLLDVAGQVLALAKKFGASEADIVASRSTDFEVKVADGSIVTLTQAVSKGMGLRVFVDGRLGFCTTSDFSDASLAYAVERAVLLAREAAVDAFNGLVELELACRSSATNSNCMTPAVVALTPEQKINWAHELETAARATDKRVTKFRDSGVSSGEAHTVLATSHGATRAVRSTGLSIWCNPIAEENGQLQTEVWYDSRTHVADLDKPADVGRIAAERAARMLGAKPVKTQVAHVIFEPAMAAGFLGGMLAAIDGDAVHKKASFLADKLGSSASLKPRHYARRRPAHQARHRDNAVRRRGVAHLQEEDRRRRHVNDLSLRRIHRAQSRSETDCVSKTRLCVTSSRWSVQLHRTGGL